MDLLALLSATTGFQWDEGNAEKNQRKHGVSRTECEQVFFNTPLVVHHDAAHAHSEPRFYLLGQTDERRLLFVAFTLRGTLVRVISARDMSRKEREIFKSL